MPFSGMADFLVEIWDQWHNQDQFEAESKFRRYSMLIDLVTIDWGTSMWFGKEIFVRKGIFAKENSFPRRSCSKPDKEFFLEFQKNLIFRRLFFVFQRFRTFFDQKSE